MEKKMSRLQFPEEEKPVFGVLCLKKKKFPLKIVEERAKYAYVEPYPSLLSN